MNRLTVKFILLMIPVLAIGWWHWVSKLLLWWWAELYLTRSIMSETEAMVTFFGVVILSLTAIPQGYWLPVHLYKMLYETNKELEIEIHRYIVSQRLAGNG